MDIVGAIASTVSCFCADNSMNASVDQKCGYLRRPKRKLGRLRRKLDELNALVVEVKTRLEQIQMQHGMEPKARVKLWLQNVEKNENEVTQVILDFDQENSVLCGPKCLCARITFGELVEDRIEEVVELTEKGMNFNSDDSLAEKSLKRGHTLPTIPMENPTSMQSVMKIWDYLMDSGVGRIGVWGIGGTGKTTVMRSINNRLLNEPSNFDSVIWVTASNKPTLDRLQKDIAKQVNLDLSDCGEGMERCGKLFDALCRRKRFVLILDDLAKPFSLEEIGIPIPTAQNGCKLVITTRSLSTCRGMETDRDVKIEVLTENEAWHLFRDKVGDSVLLNPAVQNVAREVVKECDGLPLAIVTVGRALRRVSDVLEWETALEELRGSTANWAAY